MPIIKSTKAANGISVEYHKPMRVEINLVTDTALLIVNSYTDENAAIAALSIAWQWQIPIPIDEIGDIESHLINEPQSPFFGGVITSDLTLSLDAAKRRKRLEINKARLDSNRSAFEFGGKAIACDELSMLDISSINGEICLTREMPEDWPGGWKAIDETYVAIPDIATWTLFYKAMTKQGTNNFKHAQTLKVALVKADTLVAVAAINW